MRYHESSLADFSGLLQVDSYSNALLNLTLMDVMGSVHGTISSNNFTQVRIKQGSITNYVDKFLSFFDHLPPTYVDILTFVP